MATLVVVSFLIIIGFIGLYLAITSKIREGFDAQKNEPMAQLMNQNVQAMHGRLDKAAEYIRNLGQELRSMQDIGKNIENLKAALFSPKLRGNFGERMLQDMLEAHFPKELYTLQYKFKTGDTVDAAITVKDGIIPIDSKFPLENYKKMLATTDTRERELEYREFQKAVKKHIDDISKKYILQGEGTTDYAIMYVPSEGVFYEIVSNNDELTGFAKSRKVLMASPNTMSYFFEILRLGLERIRIEENVQKVWSLLAGISQENAKFSENLSVLARHLTNAKNSMDLVTNEFDKLSSKIEQIKQLK